MRLFDHFGHLAHGHALGVWIAIGVSLFVAIGTAMWLGMSSQKDPDA